MQFRFFAPEMHEDLGSVELFLVCFGPESVRNGW